MILNEGRSILSKNVIDTFCKQITEFFFFFLMVQLNLSRRCN